MTGTWEFSFPNVTGLYRIGACPYFSGKGL